MDNLLIESTKKTPEVSFNTDGRIRISGRSIPEDATKFYDDLYEWIYFYCQEPPDSTMVPERKRIFCPAPSVALPPFSTRNVVPPPPQVITSVAW